MGNKYSQVDPGKSPMQRAIVARDFKKTGDFWCKFCGGAKCPHEDWTKNPTNPIEFEGLNCNWITENILVCQRPSKRLIRQYNLVAKLKVLRSMSSHKVSVRFSAYKNSANIRTAGTNSISVRVSVITLKTSTSTVSSSSTFPSARSRICLHR